MAHFIEMNSMDNKIPLLLQTEIDEIGGGKKVDHSIEKKETNGQEPLGSQINKSVNQIFDERFENLDNSTTIFKVTLGLSESNLDAYKPKLLSIGPYHKHNSKLDSMEKYKLRYLQRFLKRKGGMDVESCIGEIDKLKYDALKCYDDTGDLDSDILTNFSEMLLLDGNFVVEYIREHCGLMRPKGEKMIIIKGGCIDNQVRRDLLLVENQLPFFVLTKLHDMSKEVDEVPFLEMVKKTFFLASLQMSTRSTSFLETEGNEENIKHLFHVVHMHMSCHPSKMKTSVSGNRNPSNALKNHNKSFWGIRPSLVISRRKDMPRDTDNMMWHKVMPNATELSEAGVSFASVGNIFRSFDRNNHPSKDNTSLFDITFKEGRMTIPCFRVVDDTETLLRNLIAYEQQSSDVYLRYFSDFAVFMDYLIDSDKDVSLLSRKGIIVNKIGEDKEVASLFNKIGKGVAVSDNFYYKEECKKAFQHCEKPWNRKMASLKHNYFSSPWVGASTVAAIVLLILTTIQTILAFTGEVK